MVTATRVIVVVQMYTPDYTCNLPDYMCNPPDYTCKLVDYTQAKNMQINRHFTVICRFTVIRRYTTCNPPVYERPLAEDTATFFILLFLFPHLSCC